MIKLVFLLLIPILLLSQNEKTDYFDEYMDAQVLINDFSGSVLVAEKGEIIYQKAFGFADREWGVSNTIQGKYQVASVTKQFTACAILLLAEQGKLNVNDKLSKYFPNFPKSDTITIHMLLNHTSGLKTSGDIPGFDEYSTIRRDSILKVIAKQGFEFLPGKGYKYSNLGYYILGFIISKVTSMSYSDFVYQNLIYKAGLKNTMINRWDTILEFRVKGYERKYTGWKNSIRFSIENRESSGGLITNVEDLYKWNQALYSNQIINENSLKKMTTGNSRNYGYGIGIDTLQGHLKYGHSGTLRGFRSSLTRYPNDTIDVVVLSNNQSNVDVISNALAAIALNIEVMPPYIYSEVQIDSTLIDNYIGKYFLKNGEELLLIKNEGKLFRKKSNSLIELKPESINKFFYADDSDRKIEFILDKTGKVEKVFLYIEGIKEEIIRE